MKMNVNTNRASTHKLITMLLSILAIVLLTIPNRVFAQSVPVPISTVFPALQGIELTTDQQTQVNQIINNTFFGAKSILSSEQQEQLKTMLSQGNTLRDSVRSLNLSRSQMRQLQSTAKSARSQVSQILTSEQRQQWQQNIAQQRQSR
jgi:hypothetical protein